MKTLMMSVLLALAMTMAPASGVFGYIAQDGIWKDLDGDGYNESLAFYEGNQIQKVLMDSDHDGKMETIIFYKNGYRDRATRDLNQDGEADVWVSYYFTGVAWKIARDRNADGMPDYWQYLKNGAVYKWELDRNFDGKADMRISYDLEHMNSARIAGREPLKELYDDNFDGAYETSAMLAAGRPQPSEMPFEARMGL